MILGALEGKDPSLNTSASTETHQTTAVPPAISKGLGYVNKTESSTGINLSSADVFSCVWELVVKYSVYFVLGRYIEILLVEPNRYGLLKTDTDLDILGF